MEATEKVIQTVKTARYYQLGQCGPQTKRIIVAIHGYGQLASFFIKHFEQFADAESCIVAPEGLSRFYLDGKWDRVGATWMTKEHRLYEIEDYIGYLDNMFQTVTEGLSPGAKIIVLGFSQGTATAWRWAMRGNVHPHQLILWAGSIATDAMEKANERLASCTLDIVLGDQDEFIKMEDAELQMQNLRKIKPSATLWTFKGEHRMDVETLKAVIEDSL